MNSENNRASNNLPVAPPVNNNSSWQGFMSAISAAIKAIKASPAPYIFYVSFLIIVEVGAALLLKRPASDRINDKTIAALAAGLVGLLLLPYITNYQLQIAQEKKFSFNQFFKLSPSKYFNVLIVYLMLVVMTVVGAIFILIPLIWVVPWAYLVVYPVINKDYGPTESFKYVRKISKGHLSKVWAIIGIYVVATIVLARIPFLGQIIDAFLSIVFGTAIAICYLWLTHNYQTSVDAEN